MATLLFNRYQVESQPGRGGFGSTYLACDRQLDDRVVVKELPERWTKNPEICQRFVNEAQAMRRLHDPNVVTVYDLVTPKSVPGLKQYYFIMEYVPGGSVESRMRKGLTLEEVVKISIDVCQGLNRAHNLGIAHRDIKPANILLTPDLTSVKIGDFGIAHLPDKNQTA